MPSYIKTKDSLTVVFDDGTSATRYASEGVNYLSFVDAVKAGDWGLAKNLSTPSAAVQQAISEYGEVVIRDGVVLYNGNEIHGTLTQRIVEMAYDGFDVEPMIRFLKNLMQNPSYRAVTELYDFLEASSLPITEDGCFLAYKRIGENFKDLYTNSLDHSVGAVVEMPRNQVDEDKDRTCSSGLHFCSRSYLPYYGATEGNKVVSVKINPKDVVAIPSDYNNAKGRTCRYEVVQELDIDIQSLLPEIKLEDFSFYGFDQDDDEEEVDREITKAQIDQWMQSRLVVEMCDESCDDNIRVVERYDTIADAARDTAIDSSSISKVLRGLRKTAGGYIWRYAPATESRSMDDDDDNDYSITPTVERGTQ